MTTREMSDYEILAAMEVFKLRKQLDESKQLITELYDLALFDNCSTHYYHELVDGYLNKYYPKGEK